MTKFIIFIFFVIAVFNICIVIASLIETDKDEGKKSFIISCAVLVIGLITILIVVLPEEPRALEVYRGKTELKITTEYENNKLIKCDSIVVYKQ